MRHQPASSVSRSMFLVLAAISATVAVAAVGCGGEPVGSSTPAAEVVQPTETATPSRPAVAPTAVVTPTVADTPVPTHTAATLGAAVAADATATAAPGGVQPLPRPVVPGVDLHDSQVVTAPGRMRSTMAPWRDGGGNRLFSTHVFGTPFLLNEKGELVPWIATGITSNEEMTIWTMKLREDAVFQDGTPITAADFKAYWEHGAKPENRVNWGGAGLTLDDIMGWEKLRAGDVAEAASFRVVDYHTLEIELSDPMPAWPFHIRDWEKLRAGDVTEAAGLRVVDDHTLEMELSGPMPAWPFHMAAWHVGISKLEQVLADESWGNAPIGAGPFSLTYDPDSGLTEVTRVDLVGKHWNGPNDTPIIEKLVLPHIEDEQTRLVMFENGELDVMSIGRETYAAALDRGHPFNPLLYESPYGGLLSIQGKTDWTWAPLEDTLVSRALARGQDMESIVGAVWGPTATHANGVISSLIPCHNPNANYHPYDPDLARQMLSKSLYADNLPPLKIDLSLPAMVEVGVALKEYWKDNLGIDLDILKRESGVPRRYDSQLYGTILASWIPDPSLIVSNLLPYYHFENRHPSHTGWYWGRPILFALFEYAFSLPLDHPDRCAAFHAIEQEYLERQASIIPIREVDPIRWIVQPWLRGFKSTFNLDFNTLTTAYVVRH